MQINNIPTDENEDSEFDSVQQQGIGWEAGKEEMQNQFVPNLMIMRQ